MKYKSVRKKLVSTAKDKVNLGKLGTEPRLLLVDGENLLHRSIHRFKNYYASNGKHSGAIFGFLYTLLHNINRYRPDYVCIAFDNGHSPYRKGYYPEYKASRAVKREKLILDLSTKYVETLQSQKVDLLKVLKHCSIPYIFDKERLTGYEGDDFIAYVTNKWTKKGGRVFILSPDKDFNQLLKTVKVVQLVPSIKGSSYLREKDCKDFVGYTPKECVDFLSLIGDNSDNIKGASGIGPVKARKLLDEWGTLKKYVEANPTDLNVVEAYKRGKRLINLNSFIRNNPLLKKDLPLVIGKKNMQKAHDILSEYDIKILEKYNMVEIIQLITSRQLKL